ncbi:hypothetical protein X975_05923, partial [Stegodyphus mimosarum]
MSGVYNGLQQKMKTIQLNTEYVHCSSHNLQLIFNDPISGCKEITAFFDILQNIYLFYEKSINK